MSEEQQTKKKIPKILQNKKRNVIVLAILIFLILCAIFKYKILLPAIFIVILGAVIMINRKILNRWRKKGTSEVKQYTLKDNEIRKFSEYFISRDEKYVSSLGNGYIMNYLANGSLSNGFAVISDKRVYFRGSCFTGQGKSLRRTDEERTVDIKDVTGSGFIYRTYVGVLVGLSTALAALIIGLIISSGAALLNWRETTFQQNKAEDYQNKINEGEKRIPEIEGLIAANEENTAELQSELAKLEALQAQEILEQTQLSTPLDEFLYDTEINAAYEAYLLQLQDIFYNSNVLNSRFEFAQEFFDENGILCDEYIDFDWLYTYVYDVYGSVPSEAIIQIYTETNNALVPEDVNGNSLVSDYTDNGTLYISPTEYFSRKFDKSIWLFDWVNDLLNEGYSYEELDQYIALGQNDKEAFDKRVTDSFSKVENELSGSFAQAYMDFISTIAPDYVADKTPDDLLNNQPPLESLILSYITAHPDASFAYVTDTIDTSAISTEYDAEIMEIKEKLSNIEDENAALEREYTDLNELMGEKGDYKRKYEEAQHESSSAFVIAALSTAAAGLLVTFSISCLLVILDYLKKRKTMFQIQYAGGSIAFDVSFYAKAEIEDFQKQLRRTKDLTEQVSVSNTKEQSPSDELRKYAELLNDGLITQEEYDAMKKKVLGL